MLNATPGVAEAVCPGDRGAMAQEQLDLLDIARGAGWRLFYQ